MDGSGQINRHFKLEYVEHNMWYTTNFYMRATATKVSLVLYAIPLVLFAAGELLIRNGLFLIYNTTVVLINGLSESLNRITKCANSALSPEQVITMNEEIACVEELQISAEVTANQESQVSPEEIVVEGFSSDDLSTFKAALSSLNNRSHNLLEEFYFNGSFYLLSYDESGTVHVQKADHEGAITTLSLEISESGQIQSIKVDGVGRDTFPEEFKLCMWPCFQKSLEISSTYSLFFDDFQGSFDSIKVQVIRGGLHEIPEYHLSCLSAELQHFNRVPGFKVNFLNSNLSIDPGSDAGGLSRDYFDDLFKGLVLGKQNLVFQKDENSGLTLPKAITEQGVTTENVPDISPLDKELYRALGKVILFCYQKEFLIGQIFQNGLYAAALCLTSQQRLGSFEALSLNAKIKMALEIVLAQERPNRMFELLKIKESREWNGPEWAEVVGFANAFDDELSVDAPSPDAPCTASREEIALVEKVLKDALLGYVGASLAPIHAIAQGMQRLAQKWQIVFPADSSDFCEKVQGILNRKEVADSIVIDFGGDRPINSPPRTFEEREISKKCDWLKEWIRLDSTPIEEVKKFLKFATGSSSLQTRNGPLPSSWDPDLPPPKWKPIIAKTQSADRSYFPGLRSHTCFSEIEISPRSCSVGEYKDDTSDAFIRTVREVCLRDPGDYSMA